jgi:trans-2,3-dihydro-3-hydroxyanthranilate isomerase
MAGRSLPFRPVNVFAEDSPWSGNALAVVEDARDLSDEEMQAIALQFNLSETTFVLPSTNATARVRIFTLSSELPFAGHPTLGTAYVVSQLCPAPDRLSLETKAGIIPVQREGEGWTLTANAPRWGEPGATRAEIAVMLGLDERELGGPAMWVHTGCEQLVVPLSAREALDRCLPDPRLLRRHGSNAAGQPFAYV